MDCIFFLIFFIILTIYLCSYDHNSYSSILQNICYFRSHRLFPQTQWVHARRLIAGTSDWCNIVHEIKKWFWNWFSKMILFYISYVGIAGNELADKFQMRSLRSYFSTAYKWKMDLRLEESQEWKSSNVENVQWCVPLVKRQTSVVKYKDADVKDISKHSFVS